MRLCVVLLITAVLPVNGGNLCTFGVPPDLIADLADDGSFIWQTRGVYHFYGNPYSRFWVNANGDLTFDDSNSAYQPDPFPFAPYGPDDVDGAVMIAPFWSDIDLTTEFGGTLWVREVYAEVDPDTLADVNEKVRTYLPCTGNFTSTHALVITWDSVVEFMGSSSVPAGYNTFQVVLSTDGESTYAFFLYDEIQWSGDSYSAAVGFNAGDGERFWLHPHSHTPAIVDVETTSNVDVAGVWAFKVDGSEIMEPDDILCGDANLCTFGLPVDQNVKLDVWEDGSFLMDNLHGVYNFYLNPYSRLWVNANGHITFDNGNSEPESIPFPFNPLMLGDNDGAVMIAPFWSDIDMIRESGGELWIREADSVNDPTTLEEVDNKVRAYLPCTEYFQSTHAIVITWDSVVHSLGSSGSAPDGHNTFQVVLATNGESTYVFFLYAGIEWSGNGNYNAGVGFNAGDEDRFWLHPDSHTAAIVDVETTSNVGVAGVWAFKVDGSNILEPDDIICGSPLWVDHKKCGKSLYSDAGELLSPLESRVVGGADARKHEFPYQARLFFPPDKHFCGAVLIDKEWVVTAAHCIRTYSTWGIYDLNDFQAEVRIRLGDHDMTDPPSVSKTRKAALIIIHEDYDDFRNLNDIALIKLDRSVGAAKGKIRPICKPDPSDTYAGSTGIVSGWGTESYWANTLADVLQYAPLVVITNDVCMQRIPDGETDIFQSMLCASDGADDDARDTCYGDSGGPLAVKNSRGRFELVGITSWGYGCALGYPGVYTRVGHFVEWIGNQMASNN